MNTLSQANGTFAIHLLKMLCQGNPSENVCFSPMTISSALAMVLLGAKGDTAVQICQTFKESCLKFYHSEMEQLSFAEAAEKSRQHINMWVSKQTKERKPVQMMLQEDTFSHAYVKEIQAQVLVMPYEGMDLSFVILLPDEGVDISKVENNLTFEKLTAWTKPNFMNGTDLYVYLPKFQLQEDYDMNSLLQRLGILDIFHGSKADLSGMSTKEDLNLSKFVHKCVVEVNEEGTEAAAASAGEVEFCSCSDSDPETFCADHPFLFFIMHNKTNSLLFCGRFSSP
ncbi:serpin B9-like [Mus pahari]|uniref:serpin B9-like n=1 Tax=Mus pahari TaxID=10093 RepID=UPI000A307C81|nr:serpin B9-like [Mus pahari]